MEWVEFFKNETQIFFPFLIKPNKWFYRLFPFNLFLLVIVKNISKNGFDSVQYDFVYALYQIIFRSESIEIRPEWIKWLLNSFSLSQQNSGISLSF